MTDPAWEDSLSIFDIRDLLNNEAIERCIAMSEGLLEKCRLRSCRRHGVCAGPMRQKPGARLPGPWKQFGDQCFRPLCIQLAVPPFLPLTLDQSLRHGPEGLKALEAMPAIRIEDLLGNRIRRSRDARAAALRQQTP